MSAEWRFEWSRSWEALSSGPALDAWRRIFAATRANAFQRPELCAAWAASLGPHASAQALVGHATHPSGAEALLPWMVRRSAGHRVVRRELVFIGQDLFGYHDPLLSDAGLGPSLWRDARQALAGATDQAFFRLVHRPWPQGRVVATEASPVLDLEGLDSFEALLATTSANHRGDVRRRLRRLAERGTVELWMPGPGQVVEARADFERGFVPSYDRLWSQRPAGSLLAQPGMVDFLASVLTDGLAAGWASYSALRVNGVAVAWHLGIRHDGELYWWFPTYDLDWQAFSPGKALLALLIQEAIRGGAKRLHLLTGDQSYKRAWQTRDAELRAVRWNSPSARGSLFGVYDAGQRLLARVK